jgi:hypothetical protein
VAIQPFRRRIGISSPGSLLSGNAPQIADVGPSISRAAGQVFEAAQPALRLKATREGQLAAGQAEIKRDEKGRALPIETPKDAGLLYQQAFEEVAQARYISNVSLDFQSKLDAEIEAMRKGENGKKLDAESYRAFVEGTAQGILEVADPRVRPLLEQTLGREGQERTRAVYGEAGQRARQDLMSALNNDYTRLTKLVADASSRGDVAQVANYQAQMTALTDAAIKAGTIGEKFAGSKQEDQKVQYAEAVNNAISMRTVNEATPLIFGLSGDELQIVEQRLNNISSGGSLRKEAPILATDKLFKLSDFSKRTLLGVVTDRRQQIAAEAAAARAARAEAIRDAREEARTARIENALIEAKSGDYAGNYDAKTQAYLSQKFMKTVGFKGLNAPNGSDALLAFIGDTQYVPKEVISWMDNSIRSSDPMTAVNLFSSVSKARVNGAAVGDLMLARMDSRSAALFRRATMALEMNTPPSDVLTLLDKTRTSTGFTFDEARSTYNRGSSKTRGFDVDLDSKAPSYFGLPKGSTVPSNIRSRVNQAYVDNLDLHPGNPEAALDAALGQVAPLYTRNSVFRGGIGPAVLMRVATNQKLADLVSNLTIQGKPFLTAAPGGKKHTVGPGGNVKFVPADDDVADVGAYRIEVYDPTNPSRLMLPVLSIDLGAALALRGEENAKTKGAPLTPLASQPLTQAEKDKIAFERKNREPLWVK